MNDHRRASFYYYYYNYFFVYDMFYINVPVCICTVNLEYCATLGASCTFSGNRRTQGIVHEVYGEADQQG